MAMERINQGAEGEKTAVLGLMSDVASLGLNPAIGYGLARSNDKPLSPEEAQAEANRPYNPWGTLVPGYSGYHFGRKRVGRDELARHEAERAAQAESPKTAALRIYAGVKVADDLHEAMRQHLREEQQSNWRGTATVANGAAGAYLGSHVGKMMGRPGLGTAIGAVGGAIGGRMGWNAYQGSRFDKRLPAETAQAPHAAPKTAGWFSRSPAPAAPPPPPSKPPLTVQQFEQLLQRGNPGVRVARSSYDPNVLHTVENHPEHGLLVHGFSSDILDEAANDPNPEARWGAPPTDHGVPYGVEGFNSAGYKMASRLYGVKEAGIKDWARNAMAITALATPPAAGMHHIIGTANAAEARGAAMFKNTYSGLNHYITGAPAPTPLPPSLAMGAFNDAPRLKFPPWSSR